MKKFLSLALTLVFCFGLFPVVTYAADSDFVIEDVYVEGKGTFTDVLVAYNGPGGNVVIPDGVQYVGLGIGLNASGTGGYVFAGRKDITSVTIPKSAIIIGNGAFEGCTALTNITIPDSIKEIGSFAFSNSGLTSITIPGSVQKIHTYAFSGCTKLTNLTLSEGVGLIRGDSFRDCTGLTSVSFPNSATVEEGAFQNCTSLAHVNIPSSVTITGNPFNKTAWREKQGAWLIINNTLLEYDPYGLYLIGVDEVETDSVSFNPNIVIPNGVTTLGYGWCHVTWDDIKSISIPNSVTKIGYGAFFSAFSGAPWGVNTINFPDSVTEIESDAFAFSYLVSLILPDSVTVIGDTAFRECQYLSSITIPNSVTSIGDRTFEGSPNVTIHGSSGSYAEAYAKKHNIPFVADISPKVGGFNDVKESDYYATPVLWAVDKGITAGTSKTTFSPNSTCTTAQILTFLWRSQGSPEPTIKTNTFTDIKESDYFYKAALWAKENNVISADSTVFNGNTPCTRSSAVLYIWRATGFPAAIKSSSFTDVATTTIYAPAVDWAVEQGVTSGTSKTTFSPDTTCTRAQIVTFLYRAFSK